MKRVAGLLIIGALFAIAFTTNGSNASLRWIWVIAFIAASRAMRGWFRNQRVSRHDPGDPGWTPLHDAVNTARLELIPDLIASGIEVDTRTGDGMTPLHIAVQAGDLTAIEDLIGYGADVTAVDATNSTVLVMALVRGRPELVPALLLAGADPDAVNVHGMSARSLADDMGYGHLFD